MRPANRPKPKQQLQHDTTILPGVEDGNIPFTDRASGPSINGYGRQLWPVTALKPCLWWFSQVKAFGQLLIIIYVTRGSALLRRFCSPSPSSLSQRPVEIRGSFSTWIHAFIIQTKKAWSPWGAWDTYSQRFFSFISVQDIGFDRVSATRVFMKWLLTVVAHPHL